MANSTMPARVAAIKRAIEERQDFTGLAGGGEAEVFAWARAHGMNGGALVLQWHEAYRQRQAQGGRGRLKPATQKVGYEGAVTHDLDYWSDAEPEPDDDDPMLVCGACKGAGVDADGNECEICGGKGRIPAEDQPDDDREDDDDDE
jgi:hypothetical protein